ITTTCGFLSLYQQELAAHVRVPVAASSLMQIPLVERILPPGRRVGVLTVSAASLTQEHFIAAGADAATPVVGTDNGGEFTRVMLDEKRTLDAAAAERDILDAGDALVAKHENVGAIVLECTNMVPYARALSDHLLLPVYSIYTFVTWFQAGLVPRDFGPPGSGAREWRERSARPISRSASRQGKTYRCCCVSSASSRSSSARPTQSWPQKTICGITASARSRNSRRSSLSSMASPPAARCSIRASRPGSA